MENPVIEWKKAVFSQRALFPGNSRMGRAVRTNQYHYNTWLEYGEELYDIQNDPKEYTNLALNPEFTSVLDSMRSLLNNGWQGALPPVYLKRSFFRDEDGDGYGKSIDSAVDYFAPEGYVTKSGDCNDSNPSIHPNAKERSCNQKDDNCNEQVDESRPVPKINTSGSLDICLTGSVILQTSAGSGFNYQWRRNGKNIPGAVYRKYNAASVGEYRVIITYQGQCDNISDPVKVYNTCSLLKPDRDSSSEMAIIPNPSNGLCTQAASNSQTSVKA